MYRASLLCRKANFDYKGNHFGRFWLTLEQISEATGISVSNMRKYLKVLQKKGANHMDIFSEK
jgi:hypothetical protein